MLTLEWKDKKSGAVQMVEFDVVTGETHEAVMAITAHPVEEGTDVVDNARAQPRTLSIEGFVSNKPLWSNPGVGTKVDKGAAPLAEYIVRDLDVPSPSAFRAQRPSRVKLDIPKPPIALNAASLITAGVGALVDAIKGNPGTFASLAPEKPAQTKGIKAQVLAAKGEFPDRAANLFELLLTGQDDRALVTVTSAMGEIDNMLIEKVGVPRTSQTGNGADFKVDLRQVRIVKSETVDAPIPAEKRGEKAKSLGSQTTTKKRDTPTTKAAKASLAVVASGQEGTGIGLPQQP